MPRTKAFGNVAVLDQAVKILPATWWWIISDDGVDVTAGLMESSRQEWYGDGDGDVDLGDGELQKQYRAYMGRLKLVNGICREG